jgi:hypothetical protein
MCQFFITNDEKTLSAFAPRAGLAHHTVKMLEAIDKHHHLALLAHCTVTLLKHTMMASTCAPAGRLVRVLILSEAELGLATTGALGCLSSS